MKTTEFLNFVPTLEANGFENVTAYATTHSHPHSKIPGLSIRASQRRHGAKNLFVEVGARKGYRGQRTAFWRKAVNIHKFSFEWACGALETAIEEGKFEAAKWCETQELAAIRREEFLSDERAREVEKQEFADRVTALSGRKVSESDLYIEEGRRIGGIKLALKISGNPEEIARKLALVLAIK